MALGATIGHVGLSRSDGRRGAIYGALLGTLPDLDVIYPLADPVAAFTYHRTWTHAFLILTVAAPLIVALIRRFDTQIAGSWQRWLTTLWLVLVTHALLDCFTVYGTQALLPVSDYPISGSSLFIVDLFYSVPLLVAFGWATVKPRSEVVWRFAATALVISSLYIVIAVLGRISVEARVAKEGPATATLATPTPSNILVWRVVRMHDDYYEVGFRRPFGWGQTPAFERYPSEPHLLANLGDHWPVARLDWFTHGFHRVRETADGEIVMTDLRMGAENNYLFSFVVAERVDGVIQPVDSRLVEPELSADEMLKRVRDAFQKTRRDD